MEGITGALLVYGPLGVLAAIGLLWKHRSDIARDKREEAQTAALQAAATAREKRDEVSAAALQALVKETTAAVQKLASEFAAKLQEREVAHRDEVEKLMDRFVSLVERYGENYRLLLDKVSTTLESMARAAHR